MIVSLDTASKISKDCRKNKQKVVFIHGCFDLLHMGHIELFQYAKEYGNIVIVAVNSDKTIKINKGHNRPINRLEYRLKQLDELSSISVITYIKDTLDFESPEADTYFGNIESFISPDYLLTSVKKDIYYEKKKTRLSDSGISLLEFTNELPVSTTKIINKILRT